MDVIGREVVDAGEIAPRGGGVDRRSADNKRARRRRAQVELHSRPFRFGLFAVCRHDRDDDSVLGAPDHASLVGNRGGLDTTAGVEGNRPERISQRSLLCVVHGATATVTIWL